MEKLHMQTHNIVDENIKKIAELFPNCLTERLDENGKPEAAIDFDQLRQELSKDIVEGPEERYQFTWPDKRNAIRLANAPTTDTLRPCREESVDFDNTQNLYIEGDNLEVLKLLRENYLGKVKMIYIDPPYNTGNDFVYNDSFRTESLEFRAKSGNYDEEGNLLTDVYTRNTESNGRFHTDWLNMIYPRLKVAKDLLSEEGVIFISIDENESDNLKKICDEIFGAHNFITQFVWQNKKGGGNDSIYVAVEHEYVLAYAKNKISLSAFYEMYSPEYEKRYKEVDDISRFFWDTFKRKSGKQYYPIECPDGSVLQYDEDGNPISWLRSENRFKEDLKHGEIRIVPSSSGGWSVQFKQRMPQGKKPRSIFTTEVKILDNTGTTSSGSEDVYDYFKKDVFSNPKPIALISYFLGFGSGSDDIVLDFFSGSGTTAEAIMRLNMDGDRRRFILVQLPEHIDEMLKSSSENAKRIAKNAISVLDELKLPHFLTELGKERIRRAGKKIVEEQNAKQADLFSSEKKPLDIGFRVLKLDSSNMQDVYYSPEQFNENLLFEDNIKHDRTDEDLLFQAMIELGIELSAKIEKREIAGKTVWSVADNYLMACFDKEVNETTITEIARQKPYYFVMRDSSLATDNVADNFEQIWEEYSKETIRRII